MAKKRYYDAMESRDYYSGLEARRRQEMLDGGMISEDKGAIANLPQNVMIKAYSKPEYDMYDLDDTVRGVEVQMNDDVRKERRKKGQAYPEKY